MTTYYVRDAQGNVLAVYERRSHWIANPAEYFKLDILPSSKIEDGIAIPSEGATHSISDPIINKNIRKIPQMGTTDKKYSKEQPPLYEEKPK